MSRFYEMYVEIKDVSDSETGRVKEATSREWPFKDWDYRNRVLWSYADGNLVGGETESEFTDRLVSAIWAANRRYCQVTVQATALDNLPYETHIRNEKDYALWARRKAGGSRRQGRS